MVPEKRSDPYSRMISFIKLKSRAENPVTPIVYLAGGPGGAGTSAVKGQHWLMFDKLRDNADVIILYRRGTAISSPLAHCQASNGIPSDSATSREYYIRWHKNAAKECLNFWKYESFDIYGYTTWESAADIEAVRPIKTGSRKSRTCATAIGSRITAIGPISFACC